MSIYRELQVTEQCRGVLRLVHNHWRCITTQKIAGLFLSLLSFGRQIEGNELVIGEKPPECRGLAGLARTRQYYGGAGPSGAVHTSFDIARDPHVLNMR